MLFPAVVSFATVVGMTNATDKAQELLGGRIAVVGELEQAVAHLDDVRAQIDDAERGVFEAWKVATGAGWTPRELRTLGFKEPREKRAPKRARTERPAATSTTSSTNNEGGDGEHVPSV